MLLESNSSNLPGFCFLVRENPRLSPFSGFLLLFSQREPLSRTFFWLSSAFWSERTLVSHLFLAFFCFLVRENPCLALFSGFLLLFGQREPSSLTFFWLSSAFWSERSPRLSPFSGFLDFITGFVFIILMKGTFLFPYRTLSFIAPMMDTFLDFIPYYSNRQSSSVSTTKVGCFSYCFNNSFVVTPVWTSNVSISAFIPAKMSVS